MSSISCIGGRRPGSRGVLPAGVVLACLLSACSGGPDSALRIEQPPVPPGSRYPSIAAGSDGGLHLLWTETRDGATPAVRATAFDGRSWSEPTTLVEDPALFVNWADFASLVDLGERRIAAHWLVRRPGRGLAYDVVLAVSDDGGTSWSRLGRPHRDDSAAEHGFVSLAPEPERRIGVVWLDGREMPGGGPMRLMYADWNDGTFDEQRVLDPDVCTCCQTSMVSRGDDLLVAYRGHAAGEIRDVLVVDRTNGEWSAPRPVHVDGWKIGACPVNGPAVDARGETAAVAWFTGAAADPRVQVAFSADGGRSFDAPVRVDQGDPLGRVDLVMDDDGSVTVSWLETTDSGAEVRVRRLAADGSLAEPIVVGTTAKDRTSGFPRLARTDRGVWVAWTDDSRPPRVALVRVTD